MSMKAFVLNCPVDLLEINEALSCANRAIEEHRNYQIITINPEMIMNAQKNKAFLLKICIISHFLTIFFVVLNKY